MLKKDNQISRYIGGGKMYFKPKGGADWREFGEVQEAKVNISAEYAEAINKDNCVFVKAGKFTKSMSGTVELSVQNVSLENLAMARLGKLEDVAFKTGDTLPDSTVATKDITIKCINAGANPIIEGAIKFIGDGCGDQKLILEVPKAVVTPNGDFAYIADEYQTLGFSGEILKDGDIYFKEYIMDVA